MRQKSKRQACKHATKQIEVIESLLSMFFFISNNFSSAYISSADPASPNKQHILKSRDGPLPHFSNFSVRVVIIVGRETAIANLVR